MDGGAGGWEEEEGEGGEDDAWEEDFEEDGGEGVEGAWGGFESGAGADRKPQVYVRAQLTLKEQGGEVTEAEKEGEVFDNRLLACRALIAPPPPPFPSSLHHHCSGAA